VYSKEKVTKHIEKNTRFDKLEIVDIDEKECCYHIYLKQEKLLNEAS
jgi:hypothetical protein